MNTTLKTIKTTAKLFWNKGIAIVLVALLMAGYLNLATSSPFAEILYAVILAGTVIVVAPVVRLLVFPEAADYAEGGQLRKDLETGNADKLNVHHYWFATATSYIVTLLCVSKLLS